MKTIIKKLYCASKMCIPLSLLRYIRRTKRKGEYAGLYRTWREAQLQSTGYDTETIVKKIKDSLSRGRGGRGYERDSVFIEKKEYVWPILAQLLFITAQKKRLHVADFGGSLGSFYFQHSDFFDAVPDVQWNVVELPLFYEYGKKYFENERLVFRHSMKECAQRQVDVVLFSSVLQYIEKPDELLDEIFSYSLEYLIIDRSPLSELNDDFTTVQTVDPAIYTASQPIWILSQKKIEQKLSQKYDLICRFDTHITKPTSIEGVSATFPGLFLKLKK